MRKHSYLLTLALLAVFSLSALTPMRRAAAQATAPTAGSEQTPIDIRDEDLTYDENLPALGFSYETKVNLKVINTGSPGEFATVRAVVPDESTSELVISNVHYKLRQFHWHTPSEHELNGEEFPMEMHLVHTYTAEDGTQKFTVVGVWIKAGKENKELKKLFNALPAQPSQEVTASKFNLTRLLPESLESYRYDGSLTTPDPSTGIFNEGVKWIVLAEPIEMSQAQIDAFKQLFPEGNSREVQPLNGRTIRTDVEPETY